MNFRKSSFPPSLDTFPKFFCFGIHSFPLLMLSASVTIHDFFKVARIKHIRGKILKTNGHIAGKIIRMLAKRRSKRKDKAQHNSYFTGGQELLPVTNLPLNFQERLMEGLKELHLLVVPVGMMVMPSGKI